MGRDGLPYTEVGRRPQADFTAASLRLRSILMMIREKTSVFELPKNLARQVPVDEVNSPFLQGAYTAPCGAIHGVQQNVTKHAFLSDMLEGGGTPPTPRFSQQPACRSWRGGLQHGS